MTPLASRYVPHAHTAPVSVSAHVWLSPARELRVWLGWGGGALQAGSRGCINGWQSCCYGVPSHTHPAGLSC